MGDVQLAGEVGGPQVGPAGEAAEPDVEAAPLKSAESVGGEQRGGARDGDVTDGERVPGAGIRAGRHGAYGAAAEDSECAEGGGAEEGAPGECGHVEPPVQNR